MKEEQVREGEWRVKRGALEKYAPCNAHTVICGHANNDQHPWLTK